MYLWKRTYTSNCMLDISAANAPGAPGMSVGHCVAGNSDYCPSMLYRRSGVDLELFSKIFFSLFIPAVLKVHLSVMLMYTNSQTQLYIQVLATSSFHYLLLFHFSFLTCFDPFIRVIFRSTIIQSPLLFVTPITAHFAV
jgi:hypothetical protein